MAEKIEDLNLPQTVVQKIIKDALPANVNLGKDVKNAIAKAAALFIIYLTSHSTQFAQTANRKTILPQDIFDALEETEFGEIIEPLKEALNEFKGNKQKKDENSKPEEVVDEEEDDEDVDESEAGSADSDDNDD